MKDGVILFVFGLILGLSVTISAEELTLTVIHTNDEHSSLVPAPYVDHRPGYDDPSLGGYARLASFVHGIREAKSIIDEPVLLLSAGDFLGGTPFSWLSLEGAAWELQLMQDIGYDAAAVGNHEYDYGPDLLASYLKIAGYPEAGSRTALIASNTHPPQGHPLEEAGLKKHHIIELENGLTVGMFSLIGVDAVQVAPYAQPVTFSDQTETASRQVASLQAQGAELIILLSHSGVDEDIALARKVPGIHLIVGGHCHTLLEEPVMAGNTVIVQAGELLQYAGVVELAFDRASNSVRLLNGERGTPFVQRLDSSVPLDPEIHAAVEMAILSLNDLAAEMTGDKFTDIGMTVVTADFTLPYRPAFHETPFGNYVTDAMGKAAEEATGKPVHAVFQANGMLRGDLTPGSTAWSDEHVSFYDLVSLIGLGSGPDGKAGYPLVSLYLTGSEIRRILEISVLLSELMGDTYYLQVSGVRMKYDPSRAILFTVPFIDQPVPSTRSVLAAELYSRESEEVTPLKRNDNTLYHVISDYYLVAFLPMVGELLPSLTIEIKDWKGNPVENIDDTIIYREGRELKLWEAVVDYSASHPRDSSGFPRMPDEYRGTSDRLLIRRGIPLLLLPSSGLAVLITGIVFLVRRMRKRRKS